jgi:PKD repeat protein
MFNVHITQDCGPAVDLPLQVIVMYRPVADFDIDVQEACSPFTATITHKVDLSRVGRMEWYFDYPAMVPAANQDTLANPFQWTFPENNTDSVVPYRIRLYTWAPYNACPYEMEKTVLIKPGVVADFTISDSSGCHPLPVYFNNQSTGHLTNNSYHWDVQPAVIRQPPAYVYEFPVQSSFQYRLSHRRLTAKFCKA